jgi:hypothetical protein
MVPSSKARTAVIVTRELPSSLLGPDKNALIR